MHVKCQGLQRDTFSDLSSVHSLPFHPQVLAGSGRLEAELVLSLSGAKRWSPLMGVSDGAGAASWGILSTCMQSLLP